MNDSKDSGTEEGQVDIEKNIEYLCRERVILYNTVVCSDRSGLLGRVTLDFGKIEL